MLLGGAGADFLNGGGGRDYTSYVLSPAAVSINLPNLRGFGGDAAGDRYASVENFQLTGFDDRFRGTSGVEEVIALEGNDSVDGGGGADFIDLGLGSDITFGYGNVATFDGGGFIDFAPGLDTLSYERALPVQAVGLTPFFTIINLQTGRADIGGIGTDILVQATDFAAAQTGGPQSPGITGTFSTFEAVIGTPFRDFITGDSGANTLNGAVGDDSITAGEGNDLLIGAQGGDALNGGAGIDTADYSASNSGVTVSLSAGTGQRGHAQGDSLIAIENLVGSDFADTLTGNNANNVLSLGLFEGATQSVREEVDGRGGLDTLVLDYRDAPFPDRGFDVILNATGIGNLGQTSAFGFGTLQFGSIFGIEALRLRLSEAADDVITRQDANDVIETFGGNDNISAGLGVDIVRAGDGDDSVTRLPGTLANGLGRLNTAAALVGQQTYFLDGGAGIDILNIDLSTENQSFDFTISNLPSGISALAQIDLPLASVTNFELLGDVFTGNGNDIIRLINDTRASLISTGGGNDIVNAGLGRDYLDGGALIDTLEVDYSSLQGSGGITMTLAQATNVDGLNRDGIIAYNFSNQVEFIDFERVVLTGSRDGDTLRGLEQGPFFTGDSIAGDLGDDTIFGGGGNDTLVGGLGRDELFGGDGNDLLIAGVGSAEGGTDPGNLLLTGEVMVGGAGADRFILGDETGTFYGQVTGSAADTNFAFLQDFDRSEDRLQLAGTADDYVVVLNDIDVGMFVALASTGERVFRTQGFALATSPTDSTRLADNVIDFVPLSPVPNVASTALALPLSPAPQEMPPLEAEYRLLRLSWPTVSDEEFAATVADFVGRGAPRALEFADQLLETRAWLLERAEGREVPDVPPIVLRRAGLTNDDAAF
ncbi:MAG: hypothetical protein AAF568_03735, partial [Pseudomonadota bacterium]